MTKRTKADAHDQNGNQVFFSKGAPQVIVDLAKPGEAEAKQVNDLVTNLANKGYRALGVAKSTD